MQTRITRAAGYLQVDGTGAAELQPLLLLIKALRPETRAHGDTRLLFNLAQLRGELSFSGHFLLGEYVVRHLAHLDRIASVVRPETITRTSERVARAQGVRLRVFDSMPEALAWLLATGEQPEAAGEQDDAHPLMDPVRAAFWEALSHLFPRHAQAVQVAGGNLVISWAMADDPHAIYEMSTPITIRFEPQLLEHMRLASAEQRKRIASQQEAVFRAGLMGYDPYAAVPQARVIVLG